MSRNYEIGQVVYVLAEQTQTILPGIIVEEVIVKKLSGNSVSWKIKVGQGDKAKLYDSAKINGEVYGSLDEVREVTLRQLTAFVTKMCNEAEERVEKWYGREIAEKQKQLQGAIGPEIPSDKIDPDMMLSSAVDSFEEDVASKVPDKHKSMLIPQQKNDPGSLREKLENMIIDKDEMFQPTGEGEMFITGPNGERIPVKVPRIQN